MASEKKDNGGLVKIALIVGGILFLVCGIAAFVFIFVLPSLMADESGELLAADIPEVIIRMFIVFGIFIVGLCLLAGAAYVIWALFFKKKELHIVKEHSKIIREAAQLNPVDTLGDRKSVV